MSGGYGTGRDVCEVCGDPISEKTTQYEVGDSGNPIKFHLTCYGVWQRESARLLLAAESKEAGDSLQPNPPPAANDDDAVGEEAK